MQFFAIVLLTVIAAIVYGVVHDQITVRVCLEYFTVTHPAVFGTASPTLVALGWGIFTTWTAGIPFGFFLASAARNGRRRPPLDVRELLPYLGAILLAMAGTAVVAGLLGFLLAQSGTVSVPRQYAYLLAPDVHARFIAVWWAHTGSYVSGITGVLAAVVLILRRRARLAAQRAAGADRHRFDFGFR